jgi:hypothetical protein
VTHEPQDALVEQRREPNEPNEASEAKALDALHVPGLRAEARRT